MTHTPLYIVDAFASKPFTGNPAAVCVLGSAADNAWMQSVAAEMNLSETAFVSPPNASTADYNLTWFTPVKEVALCGHATLAAAHILWSTGRVMPASPIRFQTPKSGLLTCLSRSDGKILLDLPHTDITDAAPPPDLEAMVGSLLVNVSTAGPDLLIELPSEAAVRAATPDLHKVGRLPYRGVIVTARSDDPDIDFVSRFFAPAYGIDEDPVTGSAHCALAPYWAARLGKTSMRAYQASARGGHVGVELAADRVVVSGRAVTVLAGHIEVASPGVETPRLS